MVTLSERSVNPDGGFDRSPEPDVFQKTAKPEQKTGKMGHGLTGFQLRHQIPPRKSKFKGGHPVEMSRT